jgi:protein gp37
MAANIALHPGRLEAPLHWRLPRDVFAGSMTDLFGEFVPDAFIAEILTVIALAWNSTFMIITKRADRMAGLLGSASFWDLVAAAATARAGSPDRLAGVLRDRVIANLTLCVTVENDRYVGRVDALRATPAARRVVVAEPLLGPLPSLVFAGFDEISVGGESGGPPARRLVEPCRYPTHGFDPHARDELCGGTGWVPKPTALRWVRDLRDRAAAAGIAFSLHQWGGPYAGAGGRTIDGRAY